MKAIYTLLTFAILSACSENNGAVYLPPQKGQITLDHVNSLEAVVSFNAEPDADPNFLNVVDFDKKNLMLTTLLEQPYFEGTVLNRKKMSSNVEYNKKYFLDDEKKISFVVEYKNEDYKSKLIIQQGNRIYIYFRDLYEVEGISILDLDKDGLKEIVIIQYGYFINTSHYYFDIYEPLKM